VPPLCATIPYAVASPSPVPSPNGFVVKNGSNTWVAVSASIPCPVSRTVSRTYGPRASGSRAATSAGVRVTASGVFGTTGRSAKLSAAPWRARNSVIGHASASGSHG
jgi:hypothetical protein